MKSSMREFIPEKRVRPLVSAPALMPIPGLRAIEIPSESHFIPAFFHGYRDPLSERTARTLARRILALRRVRLWRLDLAPSDFAS